MLVAEAALEQDQAQGDDPDVARQLVVDRTRSSRTRPSRRRSPMPRNATSPAPAGAREQGRREAPLPGAPPRRGSSSGFHGEDRRRRGSSCIAACAKRREPAWLVGSAAPRLRIAPKYGGPRAGSARRKREPSAGKQAGQHVLGAEQVVGDQLRRARRVAALPRQGAVRLVLWNAENLGWVRDVGDQVGHLRLGVGDRRDQRIEPSPPPGRCGSAVGLAIALEVVDDLVASARPARRAARARRRSRVRRRSPRRPARSSDAPSHASRRWASSRRRVGRRARAVGHEGPAAAAADRMQVPGLDERRERLAQHGARARRAARTARARPAAARRAPAGRA